MDLLAQLMVNGMIAGGVYALVALAFILVFATGKFFNIALGAMLPVGGYAAYALSSAGVPLFLSIPGGIACASGASALCEMFVFRPLRTRKASSLVLIIASLGIATALQAFLAILFSSQLQTLPRILDNSLALASATITSFQLLIIVFSMCATLFVLAMLRMTAFGKAIRAVSDDSEVASVVGININRIHLSVAALAGAIAGCAGILVGMDTGIEPTMGLFYFLSGVIGAIVGGIGSITGGLLGSYLLGMLENSALVFVSGEWKNAIAFALLIVILLIRPSGLLKK